MERQEKLGVGEGFHKRLPFGFYSAMFSRNLHEAIHCLSQGAEDVK